MKSADLRRCPLQIEEQLISRALFRGNRNRGRAGISSRSATMFRRASIDSRRPMVTAAGSSGPRNPVAQALIRAQRVLGVLISAEIATLHSRSPCIRHLLSRGGRRLLGGTEDQMSGAGATHTLRGRPARRIDGPCMTSRPAYHLHELRRNVRRCALASSRSLPSSAT